MWAEIEIGEWIFNRIRRKSVLTLHRDYFRLRKPIERRVYEIARKMCGSQTSFEIGLNKLLKRTGARTKLKRFRHTLKEIATHNHLPDYLVTPSMRNGVLSCSRAGERWSQSVARTVLKLGASSRIPMNGRDWQRLAGISVLLSKSGVPGRERSPKMPTGPSSVSARNVLRREDVRDFGVSTSIF